MGSVFFHIDVNSAFLSWSAAKRLREGQTEDLRAVPSIVGGDPATRHGIVLAKSVPAKKYGIHTGEPVAQAIRKCPGLLAVPPDYEEYKKQSAAFISLLGEYTPDIEQVSIDECYMDFTGIKNRFTSPEAAADMLREKIRDTLKFTVNIGISDRKVLAKMASDFEKPDRTHTLYSYEIREKMWPLPVENLFMAGHSSTEVLRKLGIHTIGQLANTPVEFLTDHLKSHGRLLWEYANGIDAHPVESVREDLKGIGNSETFPEDLKSLEEMRAKLLPLSDKVAARLLKAGQKAFVVCVEIKYADFSRATRQITLSDPVSASAQIYNAACGLLRETWNGSPVRLLGIRTTKLEDAAAPEQMSLFDRWPADEKARGAKDFYISVPDPAPGSFRGEIYRSNKKRTERTFVNSPDKMKKLDEAVANIRDKYGKNAIMRARYLNESTEKSNESGIKEKGKIKD